MNPVQYIILDRTLGMTPGKLAAQAAHASVEGVLSHRRLRELGQSDASALWSAWRSGGRYAKVTLEDDDLMVAKAYIESRGFPCELIIDEGRTEFGNKLTPTALGTMIVDKNDPHTKATFGEFDLYGTYDRKSHARVAAELTEATRRAGLQRQFGGTGRKVEFLENGMTVVHNAPPKRRWFKR